MVLYSERVARICAQDRRSLSTPMGWVTESAYLLLNFDRLLYLFLLAVVRTLNIVCMGLGTTLNTGDDGKNSKAKTLWTKIAAYDASHDASVMGPVCETACVRQRKSSAGKSQTSPPK